ncbi:MAG: DUF5606 domain-containing protein [Saprospiraceae bacterium]|nr:DUF5606 domain-containing protein [Saprospiraceae bacterium]
MNLEKIVAVSGMSGLYKMAGSRNNGLIIEDLDSGKRRFASVRKHQFTPLESVSIYTLMDTVPLTDVFKAVRKTGDLPEANADSLKLQEWFDRVLPNYDEDRVLVSDIRKVIRWYQYLNERNMLGNDEEE